MIYDPSYIPRLRPIEAFPVSNDNGRMFGLRDRSGLSNAMLTVSGGALHLLSLIDGARSLNQIRTKFLNEIGQPVSVETVCGLLQHLDRAGFLEGPSFEAYYQELTDEYRRSGVRCMRDAEALGIADDPKGFFDAILNETTTEYWNKKIVGLIAPHLDYPRGRPCYADAYATLRNRPMPDRVVILGTNHFGRSTTVVSTSNDFATPLGITPTDREFLNAMEARCGGLCMYELDHANEHSIELQVAWLQHLFGADQFQMAAFLCPDPCGPTGTAPRDGEGVDLIDFAAALRDEMVKDNLDTLIIAGADFSHVGAAFGDERRIDDEYLGKVRSRDESLLSKLGERDPEGFRYSIAQDQNSTNICSAGCMFTLATVLQQACPHVLRYHQAVDQDIQTCVTCAAIAYT